MAAPASVEDKTVIRSLSPNVTILSAPFLRFGVIRFGIRTTIVKLSSGALAVFSPIPLTASVSAAVASLGNNVQYLIAPDSEHHLSLPAWSAAYPAAQILGPVGVAEKEPTLKFSTIFKENGQSVSAEFDSEFDYVYAAAHPTHELVFLHKPDRTIIVADFLFNLPAAEAFSKVNIKNQTFTQNVATKIFAGIMNTKGDALWQKRFLWFATGKGRDSVTEAAKLIAAWDFDTIVVAHGEVVEKGGKQLFTGLFEWHLNGGKKSA